MRRSCARERPTLAAAALTRLGDWAQAVSGSPPSRKAGRPPDRWASTSTTVPMSPCRVTERVRPKLTTPPPRGDAAARVPAVGAGSRSRRCGPAPARSSWLWSHAATSRRSRAALRRSTASTAPPNRSVRRVLTSQNTRQSPSRATRSISPCGQRQLRSSTCRPCSVRYRAARSSPYLPRARRPSSCGCAVAPVMAPAQAVGAVRSQQSPSACGQRGAAAPAVDGGVDGRGGCGAG